jgi:hypothetical protein
MEVLKIQTEARYASAWHGFAKMAEEHEQIPHAIERRQQQDSRAAD